jgi:hypothetical protein
MKAFVIPFSFLLIMVILGFQNSGFSQEIDNYYTIRKIRSDYYDAHPGLKTTEGSGYKDFIR